MTGNTGSRLQGTAVPRDAVAMLGEVCDHFVEHAEVTRAGDHARLVSRLGIAELRVDGDRLLIELACPSERALQLARTSIAEHLFYFAGEDSLALTWSEPLLRSAVPNLHEVTVVGAHDVTPRMRRVRFACADVTPFVGGEMHVRLLIPPKGRRPVWPGYREDGRLAWPEGEDALIVRAYTIRAVDAERGELWIDFLQHPAPGIPTPGADFARNARAGDAAALLGPGSGGLPSARSILLIGDESALPAIARIAAEVPAGTDLRAIIEIEDESEEQPIYTAGNLDLRWLHRGHRAANASGTLAAEARKAIVAASEETFIWVACEKEDVRAIRRFQRLHRSASGKYIAWYWER